MNKIAFFIIFKELPVVPEIVSDPRLDRNSVFHGSANLFFNWIVRIYELRLYGKKEAAWQKRKRG